MVSMSFNKDGSKNKPRKNGIIVQPSQVVHSPFCQCSGSVARIALLQKYGPRVWDSDDIGVTVWVHSTGRIHVQRTPFDDEHEDELLELTVA